MIPTSKSHIDRSTRAPASIVPLIRLRGTAYTEDDLEWFFRRFEHDLGVGSNFETVKRMIQTGPPKGARGAYRTSLGDEGSLANTRAEAWERQRGITAALRAIHAEDRRVLAVAFEEREWPRDLVQAFGRATGVVMRTHAAREGYMRYHAKKIRAHRGPLAEWVLTLVLANGRERLLPMRIEAEGLLARAFAAYEERRPRRAREREEEDHAAA